MTRIGINPARGLTTSYRPARVTVAVLTCIPSLDGYFENRLEVLKLVLASLKAHTSLPHDLFIFDNGSCGTVVDYLVSLQRSGQIADLLLSQRNIGKIDALRILFNAAPGELIAYNDDDILYYPGWLEAHLDVLESFPLAGMVSGVPVRNAAGHATHSLESFVARDLPGISVCHERRILDAWEADWALSTGRDPQAHLQATQDQLDLVLKAKKADGSAAVEAIGAANHFQYLTLRQVILQALPGNWTGKLMGSMIELDEAVDNLGYLRLSTASRYTRHLGNKISDEVRREATEMGLLDGIDALIAAKKPDSGHRERRRRWLLRIPGSRRLFSSIYKRLFELLYN
jgi:glycosyltransferase involved in cell wall biosynthesis